MPRTQESSTTVSAPAARRPRRQLSPMAAFVGAGLVLATMFIAAGAPSPLFVLLQHEWGFPAWVLTVAFAVYAVALLAALLVAGSLSDHLGRRPVLIGALLLEVVSMTMFVVAPNIEWVIAARAIQGLATGAAAGALTAVVVELAPERHKKLGTVLGSVAPAAGIALGALATGVAVQFSGHPSAVIFTLLDVILLLGITVLIFAPETVTRRPGAWSSLVPRMSIPRIARREFVASIPVTVAGWMLVGLYLALAPSIIESVFDIDSGLVDGAVIALLAGTGAAASYAFSRFAPRTTTVFGGIAVLVGTFVVVTAVVTGWFPLLLVGTVVGGLGFGTSFSGGMRILTPLAQVHERAELFAAVYATSYLALGIPVIAAGLLIAPVGLLPTVVGYGIVTAVAAGLGVAAQVRLERRDAAEARSMDELECSLTPERVAA